MKKFSYDEMVLDGAGNYIGDKIVTLTEREILDSYWQYWLRRMLEAGNGPAECTEENCIDEWCIVHWAWEVKDGN